MVTLGAGVGLALGMASARYIQSLLFEVNATDASMLALPWLTIFAAALLSAIPALARAVRINPIETLKAE
jgi:putative ABC transport system permease protein